MEAKLKQITTQYHTFEDNQVLTADQLNGFIEYFEDQDRLSRIFLSGVGNVCGFELNINAAKSIITISQGTGITTDGDLIKLKNNNAQPPRKSIELAQVQYKYFKVFEDSFAGYSFFKKEVTINGNKKLVPINLWEILPEEGENTNLLTTLPNIDDKVVLLYLESYPKTGDLCTSIDCNNQGIEQVARLRVLLVSKADAAYIAGLDSIYSKQDVAGSWFKLPVVAVRRIVLNASNASGYDKLKLAYHQALINDDKLLENLTDGISKIVTDFDPILKLNLPKSALTLLKSNLQGILNFSQFAVPFNIQYRYDCIKDLVDTYNEIKCLLLALREECCPDINAFPKHLMLGCIDEIQSETKHYRHSFYKSPILNCGPDKIKMTGNLVLRFFEIAAQFKTLVGETKITPSNKLLELTHRTIPFYYNVQTGLLSSWNYYKTEKNRQNTNLSYHTSILSQAPQIQNPLNYNTDKFDFYRIEGHQGKDYKLVLEEIDKKKTEYGLAFDVKALSVNINSENLNVDDYQCEFEDLNVLLRAWTAEQECILAEVAGFFSGFSIAVPGANVKEPQLNLKRSLLLDSADTASRIESTGTAFLANAATEAKFVAGDKTFDSGTYTKSAVITDNLTTDKDALGSVLKVAFDETQGGSVNDIIAKSKNLVAEKVNTDEWNSQPEIKALVIDQSIELMAHAHILSQRMPGILTDVSIERVNNYKITMSQLCALVKKMKASYQTVELSVGLKAFIGTFINQLSIVCCSGKKLQILLEEINARKESILVRLQLSKFVEKNPGLEHLAGVQPGGTFVLVYLNKIQSSPTKSDVVPAKEITNSKILTNANLSVTSRDVKSLSVAENVVSATAFNLATEDLLLKENLSILERFIRQTDLPNNTVIADFSLPYMCCSDCAPVNFIIAKPPVSLRLDKDEFCLGKDTSPLIFDVSPADGIIKADPEVTGLTIDGTKLNIDAELFPKEMLGTPIKFTVNDQITSAQLTVYKAVQFDFTVPESPATDPKVVFIPSGDLDGATFLWSFGDDNLSTERNPTHTYKLPVNEENKVTVSLTVTAPNGVCHSTVEHTIEFKVEETKIDLEKKDYCENDTKSYLFIVTPTGADAKIEGKGVTLNDSGVFVFIPANAGIGDFEFTLNGNPSGVKVSVHEAPVPKFTPVQVENQLVITNESTGAESYVWVINGKETVATDNKSQIIDLTPNSPTIWTIQLRAANKFCGTLSSEVVRFETAFREEVITINLDRKTYCQNDEKSYPFIVTPTGVDAKIEGNGVQPAATGGFVFIPVQATPGEISFTVNGKPSGLKVSVSKAPVAAFVPTQVENQLILTNNSTDADSYIWKINGKDVPVADNSQQVIPLTANSPALWTLQLEAISKICGNNLSNEIRFQTTFITEVVVTANNCIEETKAAILTDARRVAKLQNPNSDWVQRIWKETSNLYGGNATFNSGVLNDIDNYLSGKNNNLLQTNFIELFTITQNLIVEIDRVKFKADFDILVQLLGMQLKLFYNILGCQDAATIKKFTTIIQSILDRIIEMLKFLKEVGVTMPAFLQEFVKAYSEKVKSIALLLTHLKLIADQKLI